MKSIKQLYADNSHKIEFYNTSELVSNAVYRLDLYWTDKSTITQSQVQNDS